MSSLSAHVCSGDGKKWLARAKILFILGLPNPFPSAGWNRIGFFAYVCFKKGARDSASLQDKLSFKVAYGDTFTVTNNFAYQGQITASPEKYNYNELGALVQSLPILIIICLPYLTFYLLKKRIRIRKEAET